MAVGVLRIGGGRFKNGDPQSAHFGRKFYFGHILSADGGTHLEITQVVHICILKSLYGSRDNMQAIQGFNP